MAYDVTDFQTEVIQRSFEIPVLVDFWAEWCGPCRILGPTLERLAQKSNGDWALAKVNTEELVDVAQRYQVRSIPNVKLFVDGKVHDEFVGALPEFQVQQWLKKALPGKHRRQLDEAEALDAAGRTSDAQKLIEDVLSAEPDNTQAHTMLAKLVLFQDPQKAFQLLENIDDPKYSDFTEPVRTIAHLHAYAQNRTSLPNGSARDLYQAAIDALFQQEFDTALAQFIEVIRNERYYDDDGARKACIAIFKLLGEENEITLKHRRDFSSALY